MLSEIQLEKINEPLLSWFETHKRVLPWRENPTPYRVWVSEIMLQQTRVEAVKPYFERFTKELPDLRHLAECDEERLLKLWEGLGYYNRVRNMQIAAKTVMEEYQGELPADYEKLLTLKGIGLVNKVVAKEELMSTAKDMAKKIISKGSYAVSIAKAAINNGYDMDIQNAVEMEANLFGITCSTHDKKEGMTAFLERRAADLTDF